MEHNAEYKGRIEGLVVAIRSLRPDLERIAKPFREEPVSGGQPAFNKWSAEDWRRNVFGNALVRLGQLTESNFQFIETMGVLAVARYVFELSVWLHLLQKDSRYGLIYYRELLESQRKYYEDTAAHLRREVVLLKRFETMDSSADQEVIQAYKEGKVSDIAETMKNATERVDAEASRNFSLYLDDAKPNGYGFQACLVEKKAIPPVEQAIKDIAREVQDFQSHVPQDIQNLVKGTWRWRQMATEGGLAHEHDYIYAFASKLLHATPSSLTTDKKNLEPTEFYVFLRYIHVKILEIMGLARLQPECKLKALG